MREYFRHARAIHMTAVRAMDRVEGVGSSLLAGFRDFAARYPSSAQTPKAEYWQAECRYASKEYDSAQVAFAAYLKAHPDTPALVELQELLAELTARRERRAAVAVALTGPRPPPTVAPGCRFGRRGCASESRRSACGTRTARTTPDTGRTGRALRACAASGRRETP